MKLTDEKIVEVLIAFYGDELAPVYPDQDLFSFKRQGVIDFARAILKEAGVEELERDAKRYAYLRRDKWYGNVAELIEQSLTEDIDWTLVDAAIDAELEQ